MFQNWWSNKICVSHTICNYKTIIIIIIIQATLFLLMILWAVNMRRQYFVCLFNFPLTYSTLKIACKQALNCIMIYEMCQIYEGQYDHLKAVSKTSRLCPDHNAIWFINCSQRNNIWPIVCLVIEISLQSPCSPCCAPLMVSHDSLTPLLDAAFNEKVINNGEGMSKFWYTYVNMFCLSVLAHRRRKA
jgi:hypothetical protein